MLVFEFIQEAKIPFYIPTRSLGLYLSFSLMLYPPVPIISAVLNVT